MYKLKKEFLGENFLYNFFFLRNKARGEELETGRI